MLYHYTPLGAFISILQEDGLHLRMSRYSDMEDKLEVAYAMRLMKEHGVADDTFSRNSASVITTANI